MPGKVAPSVRCALCDEAAICFCVNDDAHLCAGCDVKMHSANPLLARHERRPISALACQAECASAAPSSAPATSHSTDCDVGVVPQLTFAAPAVVPPAPAAPVVAEPAPVMAAPLDLYEDSFLGRSLTTSDLLDLDELELPGRWVLQGEGIPPVCAAALPRTSSQPGGSCLFWAENGSTWSCCHVPAPAHAPCSRVAPLAAECACGKPPACPALAPLTPRTPHQTSRSSSTPSHCSGAFFDPLDDCVVPSFDAELRPASGDRHMDGATSVQVRPPLTLQGWWRRLPCSERQCVACAASAAGVACGEHACDACPQSC